MITIEEMRKLLLSEYGISSDEELEKAIKKGGIQIAVFIDPKPDRKEKLTCAK